MSPNELNQTILTRLTRPDFKEVDGGKIYGLQERSRLFVTALPRDEIVQVLSGLLDGQVTSQPWTEDYGQVHGSFAVKSDPRMVLGLAASEIAPKREDYAAFPELLKQYTTEVLYSPPSADEP
ncbi:hypothetical protein ACMT4L_13835 [Deinococcus sp. A31D244]|uniref:hypothetical protein n=1 Tax=Deinococcus sp. A31D244 TaxID=3397675 RepID=UPI0039DFB6B6